MNINKLSPEFLAAVCQYLNNDKTLHESGRRGRHQRGPWEIDPGKLMAALEDANTATTPTFTGTDDVPKECEICGGDCLTLVDKDEYTCHDCGKNFIWKVEP